MLPLTTDLHSLGGSQYTNANTFQWRLMVSQSIEMCNGILNDLKYPSITKDEPKEKSAVQSSILIPYHFPINKRNPLFMFVKANSSIDTSGGSRIFPRGGREPSRGGVNTPNFPENCMKSKEFGRPGGGVRPSRPPLDTPMDTHLFSI